MRWKLIEKILKNERNSFTWVMYRAYMIYTVYPDRKKPCYSIIADFIHMNSDMDSNRSQ